MLNLLIMLAIAAAPTPQGPPVQDPPAVGGDDIVITARKKGCDVSMDGRVLSDTQFNSQARVWAAGKPVRVRASARESLGCMSKIAFRLAEHGVRNATYVDPQGRPAELFPEQKRAPVRTLGLSGGGGGSGSASPSIRDRELRFLQSRAARLVADGKCAEARQMLLEAGDLNGAANVVALCGAK